MSFLLLLLVLLAGAVLVPVLVVKGVRGVLRRNGPRSGPLRWRAVALLVGAAAAAVYLWGTAHLASAVMRAEDGGTGSAPLGPCRDTDPEAAGAVVGYDVDYVPLRFTCHLTGGGRYTATAVPPYVNPAAAVLALTAAVCGILAAGAAERAGHPSPAPPNRKNDS